MADHGKVYPTYTPELCDAMAALASDADILTPNLTEAAIILGEPIGDDWGGVDISDAEAARIVDALLAKGAKNVVLKGIQRGDGVIRNFVARSRFRHVRSRERIRARTCCMARETCTAARCWPPSWHGRTMAEAVAFRGRPDA